MSLWKQNLAGFARHFRDPTAAMSKRWCKAFQAEPDLVADLIMLGGLVQMPNALDPGRMDVAAVDPCRLAYEAGQRDLAVRLMALGKISPHDLNQILEQTNET